MADLYIGKLCFMTKWNATLPPPALSPKIVTEFGSPVHTRTQYADR
jgi:hypothetical protein